MELEHKTFPFELKEISEEGNFKGYAAIFSKVDAMGEVIEPGAFTKSVKEDKPYPMLWYHDPRQPLGIARLKVDAKGLKVDGELNLEVQAAREKRSLMKQKAIRGLSFGFKTIKDLWEGATRYLKEVKVFEISPVTFGAHPAAIISSIKQWDEEKPFPNEHSARIKSPGLFDDKTFRRTKGGTIYGKTKVPATISIIWGKLKGSAQASDMPVPQALRFPTTNWTAAQAKTWLKDNNVKYERFEAASKSLEGALEMLKEFKGGQAYQGDRVKHIDGAVVALENLLRTEPPPGTPGQVKGLYAPILEVLAQPQEEDKPQVHLFGQTIQTLENKPKEK